MTIKGTIIKLKKQLSKRIAALGTVKPKSSAALNAAIEKNKPEIFQKEDLLQNNQKELDDQLPNAMLHPFTIVAKTPDGGYLEAAHVIVLTYEGEFEYGKGATNSSGRAVIQLPFGAFRIKVKKEGYSEDVKKLSFTSQQVESVNEFTLNRQ